MKPILYLLFLSLLWGSSFLWTKELLDHFSPTTIVFLRSLFGVLTLVPFLLLSKNRLSFKVSPFFLLVVALAGAIPWNFMGFALKGIDSGLSGILNATTPLFAVVYTIILIKIKPLRNQIASLVVGFIAVLTLFIFSGQAPGSQFSAIHALLMFGATSGYALNSILVNKYFSDIPPLHLGFWTLAVGVLLNGPISLIIEPKALIQIGTKDVLLPLLVLGCLSSGLGYVIFYLIISTSGPILATMVTFIVPFVSITLGFLFLDEPLQIGIAIGLPLIILSLVLMNLHTFKFRNQINLRNQVK
ncbi:DMT family transporter [Sporosarcina sp. FA9]|uniref:DMT family transporter n=1 Tax=Sporosarcina sp. FA9 TaxID=3413030 RepID=UPI003F657E08